MCVYACFKMNIPVCLDSYKTVEGNHLSLIFRERGCLCEETVPEEEVGILLSFLSSMWFVRLISGECKNIESIGFRLGAF